MGGFTGLYRCPNVVADVTSAGNVPPTEVGGHGNHEEQVEQLVMAARRIDGPLRCVENAKKAYDPSSTGIPMETCTLKK
jgi:hypothetical protein